MRAAGRVLRPCCLVSAISVPSTAVNTGFSRSPLYPDATLAKTSLGRRSAGILKTSQYIAATLLAMLPMAPSGPSTAPENSEASDWATVTGRSFHFRWVTSPVRLSRIDPSRLLGALAYFTSRPTSSENGRQMTGNIQAWPATKLLSQMSLLSHS